MRGNQSQLNHDSMVRAAATHLSGKNFNNVKADISGYEQPEKIIWTKSQKGHIPDVTANGIIAEVETSETVAIDHTADQLRLFSEYAKKIQAELWVVVPKASAGTMKAQLTMLNVTAKIWEM